MVDISLKTMKRSFSSLSQDSNRKQGFDNLTSLEIIDPVTNDLVVIQSNVCSGPGIGISQPISRGSYHGINVVRKPPPAPTVVHSNNPPTPSTSSAASSRTSSLVSHGRFSISSRLTDISSLYSLPTIRKAIHPSLIPPVRLSKPSFKKLKRYTKHIASGFKKFKRDKNPIMGENISCNSHSSNSTDHTTIIQSQIEIEEDHETVIGEIDNITGALIYYLQQENADFGDYSDLLSIFLNLIESTD